MSTISFVGGGNLARALISGLRRNAFPAAQIVVSNRGREKLLALRSDFGIQIAGSNRMAAEKSDLLVLAVKPQDMKEVVTEIKTIVQERKPLVISLAAGIPVDILNEWFEVPLNIIRTMSNTATLIGKGITVLYANPSCSDGEKEKGASLFQMVGIVSWVKSEHELDLMTPFVGSSVAYLYIFMEAMKQSAIKSGIDPAIVHNLALHTIQGASQLALETGKPLDALISEVATPGGVTEKTLAMLRTGGLFESMDQSFKTVVERCQQLSSEPSK